MGFVKVNGISIHYQEEGEGFPITFINGLADDLTSWQALLLNNIMLKALL